MWNPVQYTDEDNLYWCWLRALEWGRWPLFLSQIFVPLLLIFCPWFYVLIGIFIANLLWSFIRYKFVNIRLLNAALYLMILKWPVTIGATVVLLWQHHWLVAVLAFFWPILAILLGILTKTDIGRIQNMLMRKLGYERIDMDEPKRGNARKTRTIPEEVIEEVQAIVKRFNKKFSQRKDCYYEVEFKGQYCYLNRCDYGRMGPICRLKYTGKLNDWSFAIFKWSSETYDKDEWTFPGSELVDGTIKGAMLAGLEAYPV